MAWAVRGVAVYVPQATCLTQALAAQIVMGRNGIDTQVKLGVSVANPRGLAAHAWLEAGGKVVLGEQAPGVYTALGELQVPRT